MRFLYLDTLGAALPDGESTGSADEERGLILAANEQGTGTELKLAWELELTAWVLAITKA